MSAIIAVHEEIVLKLWCYCCMVVQTCSSPRKGQQVTWLHLGKSCVCVCTMHVMWWSNLCWFDSFGCFLVRTCTKRILAVNQFRNAHVIIPLGYLEWPPGFLPPLEGFQAGGCGLGAPCMHSKICAMAASGLWCIWLCCPLFCGCCQEKHPGQVRLHSREKTCALRAYISPKRVEEVPKL